MTCNFYLGTPGAMRLIPSPNSPMPANPSRGEQIFTGANGVATKTSLLYAKRTWQLPYLSLETADQDLLDAFYAGMFGEGPFRFVDPTRRNVLPMDTASFGMRSNAPHGWVASSGLNGPDPTTAPPDGVLSSAFEWTPTTSAYLFPGIDATHCNINTAPVYVPLEHTSWSVWMKASAPLTMTSSLYSYSATTGLPAGVLTSRACAVTTSWQKFNLTLSPGASAELVLPRLTAPVSVGPALYLAGAQVEYNNAATATQPGYGSPLVNITQSPGHSVALLGYADKTMYFSEAA